MSGDIELDAMLAVKDAMEDLEPEVRERVLWWAIKRFDLSIKTGGGKGAKGSEGGGDGDEDDLDDDGDGGGGGGGLPEFETFAEFFAHAAPTTDVQKALLAAYWVQEIEGNQQWGAYPLSASLKDLGHSLSNITRSLSSNMDQKPQLIVQLKKSGNSKQAKKTYKVTEAGKTAVKNMLAGGGS